MASAFVGVESHFVYTHSSAFFIDVLRHHLRHVHVFTSEWRWIHLPLKRRWDVVVFWQHFPEPWEIDALNAASIVLVPMYDNCPRDEAFWKQYWKCKIICFSMTLGKLLRGFGLNVLTVQYYPPVISEEADWEGQGLKAFFWPRKKEVGWAQVRPLLPEEELSAVHVHVTNNLSEVPLGMSEEDEKTYSISTSRWFDSPGQYKDLLRRHQVFLASRREEGIGLSFLEALSLGMAVIAPDRPTMNEYIRSGENGYLYDPDHPVPVSLRHAREWGREARLRCAAGHEAWLRSVPGMIEFLLSPRDENGGGHLDPRLMRRMIKSWPGFARYSLWKALLALKRLLFPGWTRQRRKAIQLRD